MTYSADGLMQTFATPRGATSTFAYDALGRLLADENARGAELAVARLARTDTSRVVSFTTGEGRTTRYTVVE